MRIFLQPGDDVRQFCEIRRLLHDRRERLVRLPRLLAIRRGWQRAQAEFANYKKRVERDNADLSQTLNAEVLARFLPVLDDFDLAMKNAPADGDGAQWAAGIALVHKKFNILLENNNIKRIEAEGQPFDPNLHDAVVHENSPSHDSGKVIEVLRQGYKLGERVLRPALVKVAK